MKVILNDYVEHLGERGDTVLVKPGYARNYLIPKGLAYPDTPGNRKLFDQEQKRWEDLDLGRRSAAEKLAQGLAGTELLFERRAGEKDVLFGSVSALDIARELAERGVEVEKRRIQLDEAIKELGSFEVVLQVHRDVQVTLPVHVVRPGEEPQPAAPELEEPELEESAAPIDESAAYEAETDAAVAEPEDAASAPADTPADSDTADAGQA